MSLLGAFSETKDATEETQTICDQMSFNLPSFFTTSTYNTLVCISVWICCVFIKAKAQVEEKTNKKYEEFRAVKYRSQVVAGTIFLIKVHVGGVNYIHLRVLQVLPCNGGGFELLGVEQHKTKDDPLVPFNH